MDLLRDWVKLGWRGAPGKPLERSFTSKLFKIDQDYRGDAKSCAEVLPLVWGFTQEILVASESMKAANASLNALYCVTNTIWNMKRNAAHAASLLQQQSEHMEAFATAYGADKIRPKMHFAMHLSEQVKRWKVHVDCWVCERKHQLYKSVVGPRCSELRAFNKSVLLHLTEYELCKPQPLERYTGRLITSKTTTKQLLNKLTLPNDASVGRGIEYRCVEFLRGMFVAIDPQICLEIHGGVQKDKNLFVVVEKLKSLASTGVSGFVRTDGQLFLWPATATVGCKPMRLSRRDGDVIHLLP